jgi:hypothetical protein
LLATVRLAPAATVPLLQVNKPLKVALPTKVAPASTALEVVTLPFIVNVPPLKSLLPSPLRTEPLLTL